MRRRMLPLGLVLPLSLLSFYLLPHVHPAYAEASGPAAYECEGNACSVVALTWDQERQQFRVQNDSDQPVKVEVSTFAGSSSISVGPHKVEYLEVKTFNGPYHATYQ